LGKKLPNDVFPYDNKCSFFPLLVDSILGKSLSKSGSYLIKAFLALDLLSIRSREKILIKLSIKPNHEQSWDGKPRLRAETQECL
jgi:hypothetical protein